MDGSFEIDCKCAPALVFISRQPKLITRKRMMEAGGADKDV